MLEKEFDFFKTNQESLVKKYKGKILVIVQEEVAGIYENNLFGFRLMRIGTIQFFEIFQSTDTSIC